MIAWLLLLAAPLLVSSDVGCKDADKMCSEWAQQGECSSNAVWMMANCRKSCHSCQGGDRAWRLRTHIQETYKNETDNATREVRVESVRINNVELDERRQNVKVFGRMVLSWNDTKVAWDKDQWGLSWLNFYWVQIWTPQIAQINGVDPTSAENSANELLQGFTSNPGLVSSKVLAANHTGQIYLWVDFSFNSPYQFLYEEFPVDVQRVCYKFDDKRLLAVKFSVSEEVKNKNREEFTDTRINGWQIDGVEMMESPYTVTTLSDWHKNPFDIQAANCQMCVTLRRNSVYYVAEMLLPALITSMFTISAVFFQLSKTQPILLGFSVVAQILTLILVSQRLPSFTTHTPTILKYAGFNLTMTAILFVVSLFLERISQTPSDIPPPHFVDRIIGIVDRILPLPMSSKHEDNSLKYAPAAHATNHVAFGFAFAIYLIVIVCSFVF